MCLIISKSTHPDTSIPLIAEKDIICYKVLHKRKKWAIFTIYKSPIFTFTWKLKTLYKTSLVVTDNVVEQGLHTFSTFEGAISYFAGLHNIYETDVVYVAAIIPKGAKYYVGRANICQSYASDQLKLIKEIKACA